MEYAKMLFQTLFTIKKGNIGAEWTQETLIHGLKCYGDDIMALGKRSSHLGDSYMAAECR